MGKETVQRERFPWPLRRKALKTSLILFGIAWVAVIVTILVRASWREAVLAVVLLPAFCCMVIGMCWYWAYLSATIDESSILLMGPRKDLQIRGLRGPMLAWVNQVIVIMPALVLGICALGLMGVLPLKKTASEGAAAQAGADFADETREKRDARRRREREVRRIEMEERRAKRATGKGS